MIRQQFERGSDRREELPERRGDEKPEPSGRGGNGELEQPDEVYYYRNQELTKKESEKRQEPPRRGSDKIRYMPRRGGDKVQDMPRRGSG